MEERTLTSRQIDNRDAVRYASGEDTPYTGWVIDYYDSGQLKLKEYYLDGKVHGEWLRYHPDGMLEYRKIFEHGTMKDDLTGSSM